MSKINPYTPSSTAADIGLPARPTVTPINPVFAGELAVQISFEIYSQLLYWKISASMDLVGLKGASKFFLSRYNEERAHGEKIFQYLLDKQVNFNISGIEPLTDNPQTLKEAFEAALNHELLVTQSLLALYTHPNCDAMSQIFLQWFVSEQVEEENTLKNILDRITQASGNPGALLLIDHELAG
jgi:ferritin